MTLALKDVELRVGAETHVYATRIELAARGFNILLGPTLAGKTSLMRLMAGLLRPTAGEVQFGGPDVTPVPGEEGRVAVVDQPVINYPHPSVLQDNASPVPVQPG